MEKTTRFLRAGLFCILTCATTNTVSQNLQMVLGESWNGTEWENSFRAMNMYDTGGNLTSILTQTWESGDWLNISQILHTNNPDGTVNQSVLQCWDAGSWMDLQRESYTYNSAQQLLTTHTEFNFGTWMNSALETNTYDDSGLLVNLLEQSWDMVGNVWVNSNQTVYTNNANGAADVALTQMWNAGSWNDDSRITFTYNAAGNMLTAITEAWMGTMWMNETREENTYDENNYLIANLIQTAGESTGEWINMSQTLFTNNPDGTPAVAINQIADDTENWVNSVRLTYSYESLSVPDQEVSRIAFYPNPARESVYFNGDISGGLNIFDINGRKVLETSVQQNNAVDVSRLKSGTYFVKIGNRKAKLIKQ